MNARVLLGFTSWCVWMVLCCCSALGSTRAACRESDAEALLEFQAGTIPANPGLALNWENGTDCCTWNGVTCSPSTGAVQTLQLLSYGLNGTISSSICRLTSIQKLDLSDNNFSKVIPSCIGNLTALTYLTFYYNSLTGEFPSGVCNWTRIQHLDLSYNSLQGSVPTCIWRLKELRTLNLGGAYQYPIGLLKSRFADTPDVPHLEVLSMVGIEIGQVLPQWIGNLANLSYLSLGSTQVTGRIPDFHEDSPLEYLSLRNNKLTGLIPASLTWVKYISVLDLSDNELTGTIPDFNSTLSSSLDLSNNNLSGPIPESLGKRTQMKSISLYSNFLSGHIPNSITNMSNLQYITLANNVLNGTIPEALGTLQNLFQVDLSKNMLTGNLPSSFQNLSKTMRLFVVGSNLLHGEFPSWITSFSVLQVLDLSHNNFGGVIPDNFAHLNAFIHPPRDSSERVDQGDPLSDVGSPTVINSKGTQLGLSYVLGSRTSLDLSYNFFTGPIPKQIQFLTGLRSLTLSHNYFNGSIPDIFNQTDLPVLESLDLNSNNLTGSIPFELLSMNVLSFLNVSYNQLSGAIAASHFSESSFSNNLGLCGDPLPACPSNSSVSSPATAISSAATGSSGLFQSKAIVGVVVGAAIGMAGIIVGLVWWVGRRTGLIGGLNNELWAFKNTKLDGLQMKLSVEFLEQATDGFAAEYEIGEGASSKVYRIVLPAGTIVAAKVLKQSGSHTKEDEKAAAELYKEVRNLSKLRHRNVLKVLGFCSSQDIKAAILEYMPNGSLHTHLHGQDVLGGLSWESRLNIAVGVAQGLHYLHDGFPEPIIHRDLSPNNILLDDKLEPKICDFGLGKFVNYRGIDGYGEASATAILWGTVGYIPPEYSTATRVSTQGDVYSYGMVLLELLTGKKPTGNNFGELGDMVMWVSDSLPNRVQDILDPALSQAASASLHTRQQMTLLLQVGLLCCRRSPRTRPRLKEVLEMLQFIQQTGNSAAVYPTLQELANAPTAGELWDSPSSDARSSQTSLYSSSSATTSSNR